MDFLTSVAGLVILYVAARLYIIVVDTIVFMILLFLVWPILDFFKKKRIRSAN